MRTGWALSCQAVSRWENGTSYPDLELLPPLAEIFHVTSDFLLGIPEEQKEQEAKEAFTKLAAATCKKEINTDTIVGLIREIRLYHLQSKHFYNFWVSTNLSVYRMPELLPEVRITAETILEGDFNRRSKDDAIRYFSWVECEEKIEDFLNRYAAGENLSKRRLLFERYVKQGQAQKSNILRQELLMEHMDQLVGGSSMWCTPNPPDACPAQDYEILRRKNTLCLTLLHQFCNVVPDRQHPISGNGEVDLWIEPRLRMGVEETCFLSQAGEYDKALLVLEDVVSLLEKAMAITLPVTVGCSSPWLKDIQWTAEESWGQPDNYLPCTEEERMLFLYDKNYSCYCIYPSTYYHMLTVQHTSSRYTVHGKCLDPLRDNLTFQNLTERIRLLIVRKDLQITDTN